MDKDEGEGEGEGEGKIKREGPSPSKVSKFSLKRYGSLLFIKRSAG
jgi:hypothetical protein